MWFMMEDNKFVKDKARTMDADKQCQLCMRSPVTWNNLWRLRTLRTWEDYKYIYLSEHASTQINKRRRLMNRMYLKKMDYMEWSF